MNKSKMEEHKDIKKLLIYRRYGEKHYLDHRDKKKGECKYIKNLTLENINNFLDNYLGNYKIHIFFDDPGASGLGGYRVHYLDSEVLNKKVVDFKLMSEDRSYGTCLSEIETTCKCTDDLKQIVAGRIAGQYCHTSEDQLDVIFKIRIFDEIDESQFFEIDEELKDEETDEEDDTDKKIEKMTDLENVLFSHLFSLVDLYRLHAYVSVQVLPKVKLDVYPYCEQPYDSDKIYPIRNFFQNILDGLGENDDAPGKIISEVHDSYFRVPIKLPHNVNLKLLFEKLVDDFEKINEVAGKSSFLDGIVVDLIDQGLLSMVGVEKDVLGVNDNY